MKQVLIATAAAAALMVGASSASAATFVVTNVSFPNLVNVDLVGTLPGGGSYDYEQGAGPIFLTGQVNGGPVQTVFAYCDDIPHHIDGGAQTIVYQIGAITQNNAGDNPATNPTLSPQTVDDMIGLAKLGYQDYLGGDNAGAGVAQVAIWVDEYGLSTGVSGTHFDQDYGAVTAAELNTILSNDLALTFGAPNPALPQLLNTTGVQAQIDVQGQVPTNLAVPEPATWAMMILGLGLVGLALRQRKVALAA